MICKRISIKVNGKKQLAKVILNYKANSRVWEILLWLYPYFTWKRIKNKSKFKVMFVYEKFCSIIKEQIIQSNVCISVKLIMESYRFGQGQHQYWLKLRNRLIKTFGDETLFLTLKNDTQKVIISRNSLARQPIKSTIKLWQENIFKKVALWIRQFVTEFIENSGEVSWPHGRQPLKD